ncbi:MAG TPA: 2-C-methyl-D-erythritol 4-phosphate cytidylyltransferase [Acidimicrobiia bacterium]|nr:2-C-methyl-D-erythritol 4-phosphate cytidylyltransferase [Acidimicrobiia bacterium]
MSISGIVVAAGSGRRFGAMKQHVELDGVPVWQWARRALIEGGVDEVVVVGPVEGGIPGGLRRRDSVAAGLGEISDQATFVLVHDAARPLASPDLVDRVIKRLQEGDVDGVVPVVPVRDTLKEVSGQDIVRTVDRLNLVTAQTPQGFRVSTLARAHASITADASDDASMVEAAGGTVAWVAGDPGNLKLTFPEDLKVLEALL